MTHSPKWDLSTIPYSAIPDELLRSWWAQRSASRVKRRLSEESENESINTRREYQRNRLRAIKEGTWKA